MVSPGMAANAPMVNFNNILNVKDSRWLQLEVCREFQRNKCSRADTECKFAHPPANVEVQNGKVTACYDSIKGRCNREKPPCKYFHPPNHLKEQLLINGRNTLALKNAAFMMQGLSPAGTQLMHQSLPLLTRNDNIVGWDRTYADRYTQLGPPVEYHNASSPYLTNMPPTMANFSPYVAASSPMMTVGVSDGQMTAPMILPQQVVSTQKVPRTDRLEAYPGMGVPYKRPASDKTGGLQVYQPTSNAAYHQALMQQLGAQSYVPVSCEYPAGGSTNTPTTHLALPPPHTVATDIAAAASSHTNSSSQSSLSNHLNASSTSSSSNSLDQHHPTVASSSLSSSQPSSSSTSSLPTATYSSPPPTTSATSSSSWKDASKAAAGNPGLGVNALASNGPHGLPTVPPPPLPHTLAAASAVPGAAAAAAAAAQQAQMAAAQSASLLSYQAYAAAYNKSVMAAAAARQQQLKTPGYPPSLGGMQAPSAYPPSAVSAAQFPQFYQMGAAAMQMQSQMQSQMQPQMMSPANPAAVAAAATMASYIPPQGGLQMPTASMGHGAMAPMFAGAHQLMYPGSAAMMMPHLSTVPASAAAVQQVVEQPYKKLKTS